MSRKPNIPQKPDVLEKTEESINRVKHFDTSQLIRRSELGEKYAFEDAVGPAEALKIIFIRLPSEALAEFPNKELAAIMAQADNIYNLFQQIIEFDLEGGDVANRKTNLIDQLTSQYQPVFTALFPFISYSVARIADFDQLAADGRAAVQSVRDEVSTVMKEINDISETANSVLQEVRDAAAEQGVTQMAKYFGAEANNHQTNAAWWLKGAVGFGVGVGAYAVFSLYFVQFDVFKASSVYDAAQLVTSKLLVFGTLAYGMIYCARNHRAERHNEVLNKHRQNALMTYTTLAEAGSSQEARDTILSHAASAIYSPGESGFVNGEDRSPIQSLPVSIAARAPSVAE